MTRSGHSLLRILFPETHIVLEMIMSRGFSFGAVLAASLLLVGVVKRWHLELNPNDLM